MIVELELQQFIKEIESKLSTLNEEQYNNAINKIAILEMAIKEIRETYKMLRESSKLVQAEQISNLRLIQENTSLYNKIENYEEEIKTLKNNI